MGKWEICIKCGRKRILNGLFPASDGLCPDCRRDSFAAAELEAGETEFNGEDEVRCPWCGKRVYHDVGSEIQNDVSEENCPHCGKRYEITPECHWTYDTKRVPG